MKYSSFGVACAMLCAFGLGVAHAAVPFDSATVSLIENKVYIGTVKNGQRSQQSASIDSVVTSKQYVATETASRAELKFPNNSIVRVGQNTVFSFEAKSRTLDLEKGTMLFCVPHGTGGGTIKTPSLTAAITGTIGKVSANMIAVLRGQVKVQVFGKWYTVDAGWALEVIGNEVRVYRLKKGDATSGKLYYFGGALPEIPDFQDWPVDHNTFDPTQTHPTKPVNNRNEG
jgi:hypothetical protein